MQPSVCRTVIYQLSEKDATEINRRRTTGFSIAQRILDGEWPRGAQAHIGLPVEEGDEFPLIVVRVNGYVVSGQVLLDGTDTFWVREAAMGLIPGCWHWPASAHEPDIIKKSDSSVPRRPNCF